MTYASYCRLDVHIYASDREVLKAIWRKHFKPYRAWTGEELRQSKAARRTWYRIMLEQHKAARVLAEEFRL